ncbi:MAG: phosphate ABC transporter substrate-binding protein PstS [Dechloromonas sp.]|nr:phosphate ABC transporter substrate-binding protein PstS [Dechloromonas sp.]
MSLCLSARRLVAACLLGASLLPLSASIAAEPSHAPAVSGTGGSSATRVLTQWNFAFAKQTGIQVTFVPATSDVGIREMIAHKANFGSTEIPLSAEELKKNDLIQFPLLIGGVVVIVNLPGIGPGTLRLTPNLISRIFLGEIRVWNDADISAANPDLALPRLPIQLFARETAASTTLALTTFLAKTDKTWAARVGPSKLPKWPAPTQPVASVMAMGEQVAATRGAIGYINFDEAYRKKLSYTQIRNRSGNFVTPSRESIHSATIPSGLGRSADHVPDLIDVAGTGLWPIVEVTYVLLDQKPKSVERARSTLRFFYWAFLQGDQMAAETGFVPLPSASQARVVGRFGDVIGPDRQPVDFLR